MSAGARPIPSIDIAMSLPADHWLDVANMISGQETLVPVAEAIRAFVQSEMANRVARRALFDAYKGSAASADAALEVQP